MFLFAALHIKLLIKHIRYYLCKYYIDKQPVRLPDLFLIENVFHIPVVVCVEGAFTISFASTVCIWTILGVTKMV
jgi:hypothetical protein